MASYLKKQELNRIRKRLHEIEKITKINRTEKSKLLNELNKITTSLEFKKKSMISDYRDNDMLI